MRRDTEKFDSTSKYLQEMGKLDVIPHEELMGLIERAQTGDEKARNKCIEANLRLVVTIAREYGSVAGKISLMDLVQEGNIGLMESIGKFDTKRGVKFSTYAVYWIRNGILKAIKENSGTVRFTVEVADKMRKVKKERNQLCNTLGKEPSEDELEMHLIAKGWSSDTVNRILEAEKIRMTPLQGTGKDDEMTAESRLADPNIQDIGEMIDSIHAPDMDEMLSTLPERLQHVLRGVYVEDQTLFDIGRGMGGLSRERVRQLREQALAELREKMATELSIDSGYEMAS